MANICDNRFFFTCEHNFDKWNVLINKVFDDHFTGDIDYADYYGDDGGTIEGYFDSKWTFPLQVFEDLFKQNAKEDDVYFRCLSQEYGCGYVAMNIFKNGEWLSEQTFDVQ